MAHPANSDDSTPRLRPARSRPVPETDTERLRPVRVLGVASPVLVSGGRDERIGQIAGYQRGRVAYRQLVAAGISRPAIGRMAARGALVAQRRGVYGVGHCAPVPWGPETSALLAAREGTALSTHSGATAYELLPDWHGQIELVVTVGKAPRLPGVVVHRSRTLTDADIWIRHRLPVTSPARTLLDLAAPRARLSDRRLELAYDRAVVADLLRATDAQRLLERNRGHPGWGRLADLVAGHAGATTLTRSEAEERLLALVRQAGLPPPALNQPLGEFEVDFLWARARLVVEVDGYRYHRTRAAFERDHRKDRVLSGAGYTVLRFSARQLLDEPLAVAAAIAGALGAARVPA